MPAFSSFFIQASHSLATGTQPEGMVEFCFIHVMFLRFNNKYINIVYTSRLHSDSIHVLFWPSPKESRLSYFSLSQNHHRNVCLATCRPLQFAHHSCALVSLQYLSAVLRQKTVCFLSKRWLVPHRSSTCASRLLLCFVPFFSLGSR